MRREVRRLAFCIRRRREAPAERWTDASSAALVKRCRSRRRKWTEALERKVGWSYRAQFGMPIDKQHVHGMLLLLSHEVRKDPLRAWYRISRKWPAKTRQRGKRAVIVEDPGRIRARSISAMH